MIPGRKVVARGPSVQTHHWPRRSVSRTVLREGVRDVLPDNRVLLAAELGLGEDLYAAVLTRPEERVWSSVWVFENAKADVREAEKVSAGK